MTRHWRHTPCGVWQLRCKPGSRFSRWFPILFLPVSSSGPFSWDLSCAWYWCGETRSVFCLTSLLGKLGCLAGGFLVHWSARWTLLSWETGRSRWLQSWFCWSLPTTFLPSLRWGSLLPASWWLQWSLALLWSTKLGRLHVEPVGCERTAGHKCHQWKWVRWLHLVWDPFSDFHWRVVSQIWVFLQTWVFLHNMDNA